MLALSVYLLKKTNSTVASPENLMNIEENKFTVNNYNSPMSPNPESLLANDSEKWAVGTKFKPTDEVLAGYYLARKVSGVPDGPIFQLIKEVDIYQHEPSQLSSFAHSFGDRHMYFFTTLQMGNGSGTNLNRLAPSGCWEETKNPVYLKDKDGKVFAAKKTLAYYKNDQKFGKQVQTRWLMEEYMLLEKQNEEEFRMLAPLTLCVVYPVDNNKRSYCEDYCEDNLVMPSTDNLDFPRKRRRPCSDLHGGGHAFDIPFANSDQNTEMGSWSNSIDSDVHIPVHFPESQNLDSSMNADDDEPLYSLADLFSHDC